MFINIDIIYIIIYLFININISIIHRYNHNCLNVLKELEKKCFIKHVFLLKKKGFRLDFPDVFIKLN